MPKAADAGHPILPTTDQELLESEEPSAETKDPKDPKESDKDLFCFYCSCQQEMTKIVNKAYTEQNILKPRNSRISQSQI